MQAQFTSATGVTEQDRTYWPSRPGLVRYGGSVLLVAAAVILREALDRLAGGVTMFVVFYPAMAFAAVLGGLGPGILATVLSMAAVHYLVPRTPGLGDAGFAVSLTVFLATGTGISLFTDRMERIRKRSDETLKRSSLYARRLIEASPDPLVTINAEGKITDVNKATEEATGVPRSSLIGKDFADYFTEPEKARAGYREAFERGQVIDYPLTLRHASGKTLDVLYNASVYRDASGAVAGVFAAARDITERKRDEETIRLEAQRYATILNTTISGFWVIDLKGKLLEVNEAYAHMSGYSREELLRLSVGDLEATQTREKVASQIEKIRSQRFEHFESRHQRKDGSLFDVEITASYWPEMEQILVFARDITDRKRAEEEVRWASLYTRSLIEASLDPLVTISAEGKITDVNKATEEATGVSRSSLIGTDFANYFTEPEKARAGYRQAFERGQVTDYPLALRHVSGKVMEVLYNANVYRDEHGRVAGLFAAARNVTERNHAERELALHRQHLEELVEQRTAEIKLTNQRLEASNQELETFAYSVSHDLRTPLRAVDGFSRILTEEYAQKLDPEGQRIVGVIRDSTRKMAQMIDDILAFSRAGRIELSPRAIDMDEMVRMVLKDLEPVVAGRDLKIEIKPLPPAHGDPGMIQRVWTNLLDNAVKFTKPKPAGVIEVEAQSGEKEVIYYVKDNGVGFDPNYSHKLFGVFQRLHGVDEFPGTGIGLAIVKRIVARHGGRVWAEGKVGVGATVYFSLPNGDKR